MSDFIDRAKLEALAKEQLESHDLTGDQCDAYLIAFLSGVDATLALLDAETTEERASRIETLPGGGSGTVWYARRVTPWLPSEGGEKRG